MRLQDMQGLEQYEQVGGVYIRILHPMSKAVEEGQGLPGQLFISPLNIVCDSLHVRLCAVKTVIEHVNRKRDSQPEVLRSYSPGDAGFDQAKRMLGKQNPTEEGESFRRKLDAAVLVTEDDSFPYEAIMALTGLGASGLTRALPRVFHSTATAGGTSLWAYEWVMTTQKSTGRRGASWVPTFALSQDSVLLTADQEAYALCETWGQQLLSPKEEPEKPATGDPLGEELPF